MKKLKNKYRIALGIEYNGKNYYGWQSQKNLPNIQDTLEYIISKIANQKLKIYCAGRTDSKVHSIGQVIHFDTNSLLKKKTFLNGINSILPKDITVKWFKKVPKIFHSRFSAIYRSYCYIINNNSLRSSFLKNFTLHYKYPLDIKNMIKASKFLLGKHNFNSFRSKKCKSITPYRKIYSILIKKKIDYIYIYIKANSFLQHMVRNIIGSLILVGSNIKKKNWILYLLKIKDINISKFTISSSGLYLNKVKYSKFFNLPN